MLIKFDHLKFMKILYKSIIIKCDFFITMKFHKKAFKDNDPT